MSLRSKIVLILVAVVVLYAGVDNVSSRLFAGPFYEGLEAERAEKDLALVEDQIADELNDLRGKAQLYAGLDDVRALVRGEDPGFSAANLGSGSMLDADLDVAFFCGRDGKVHWGKIIDPETGEFILLKEMPGEGLRETHPVLNFKSGETFITGLMATSRGPLLIGSVAIGGIDPKPDRRFRPASEGAVVLGRFLNDQRRKRVLGDAVAHLKVFDLEQARSQLEGPEIIDELTGGFEQSVSRIGSDGKLQMYSAVPDLRTGAPLVLEVSLDREFHRLYLESMNYLLVSTLAGACLILFVLLRLLRGIVINPLMALTHKAVEIGRRDDTTIRVDMQRDDEIGQLAGEFDRMLEKLALSRAQVVKSARLAGMSEIATGVLHNVGNVLNSVNVSASLVTSKAEKLSAEDLERMVNVLRPYADDFERFVVEDPRGKHFLPFLFEVTESLVRTKRDLLNEVVQLGQGIEHIAELVRSQQNFAVSKGVFEMASLEAEIEGTVRILEQVLGTSRVDIHREFESLPSLPVDRHKLMEILVNLIQNARQALDEADIEDKRITLRLKRAGVNARVEVVDNGTGIAETNLARVFQHGFTTKEAGHGFGLHASANAAVEMGGSLRVESDGVGHGATFILELPLEPSEMENEKELAHAA